MRLFGQRHRCWKNNHRVSEWPLKMVYSKSRNLSSTCVSRWGSGGNWYRTFTPKSVTLLGNRMLKWRIFSSFKNKTTSVHMNRHGERNHGKGDHGDYESAHGDHWGERWWRKKEQVKPRGRVETVGPQGFLVRRQAVSPSLLLLCSPHWGQNDPLKVKVSLSWYPVRATSVAPLCSHLQSSWTGLDFRVLSEVSLACVCSLFSSPKDHQDTHTLASFPLELQNFRPIHPEIYCSLSDFS